jgi:hypothetical protein
LLNFASFREHFEAAQIISGLVFSFFAEEFLVGSRLLPLVLAVWCFVCWSLDKQIFSTLL